MVPTSSDADSVEAEQPSKSARKRAALEAQRLGEELIRMRDAELDSLGLPDRLAQAIRDARRITSHGAAARQRQYIGKLMREVDLGQVQQLLAARTREAALAAQRFQRIESWRERLIDAGPAALAELASLHPQLERARWTKWIEAARSERARAQRPGAAARALFRALRELLDGQK
jgi:ribosome-associated protein